MASSDVPDKSLPGGGSLPGAPSSVAYRPRLSYSPDRTFQAGPQVSEAITDKNNFFQEFISLPELYTLASRYYVYLIPPAAIQYETKRQGGVPEIVLRAGEVSVPELQIVNDFSDQSVYPEIKVASGLNYSANISITFLCSPDLREHKMLLDWAKHISLPGTGTVKYFNDYVGQAIIQYYDTSWELRAKYKFFNVYPNSVGEIKFVDGPDSIMTFNAMFNYTHFEKVPFTTDEIIS